MVFVLKFYSTKTQIGGIRMKLLKKYEDRLNELRTQKTVIEREILWVEELIESLKKETYKSAKATEIMQEAETDEFQDVDTAKAILTILEEKFPNAMHQKEIAKEMFRRGWKCDSKTPDQTVGTALYRLQNKDVEKVGRGTFRLKQKIESEPKFKRTKFGSEVEGKETVEI